jgi:clan AA aspartic protease (TIGR02281 family)
MQRTIVQVLFMVGLVAGIGSAWGAGTIFKCKNQQGAMIYQKTACNEAAETVTSWTPAETSKSIITEAKPGDDKANKPESPVLKLKQGAGGHYATDGTINGKALNFVVDTGATVVSLPEEMAHNALIYCDSKIDMRTANGKADACAAKIKKLQFGPFVIEDVAAAIVPNLDQPLLGMNVLQMFKIGQENSEMQISVLDKEKVKP